MDQLEKRLHGRHWEPDPAEAPVVRRIFALYLNLHSYNGVAAALTRAKVPTRKRGATSTSTLVAKVIAGRYVLGEFFAAGGVAQGRARADH